MCPKNSRSLKSEKSNEYITWKPTNIYNHITLSSSYLLTPWCRVLLETLTDLQLVKKFTAFYGTRRYITALTSVRHPSLSCASPIQSTYPHPTSWRSVPLRIRNVSDENCRKNQNTLHVRKTFFQTSCLFRGKAEKRGKARQARGDNITRRVSFQWRKTKARKQTYMHKV